MPNTTTSTKNAEQRSRRTRKPEMTPAQKRRLVDRHIKRVQQAEAGTTTATWKLADELAALISAYKKCNKYPPTAKKLVGLTGLDRDGTRMQLLAKVAVFFPKELRKPGVGVRVHEAAYKANQSLKARGRERFPAEEVVRIMADTRSADVARQYVEWAAQGRDLPGDTEEVKKVRDQLLANTPNY